MPRTVLALRSPLNLPGLAGCAASKLAALPRPFPLARLLPIADREAAAAAAAFCWAAARLRAAAAALLFPAAARAAARLLAATEAETDRSNVRARRTTLGVSGAPTTGEPGVDSLVSRPRSKSVAISFQLPMPWRRMPTSSIASLTVVHLTPYAGGLAAARKRN